MPELGHKEGICRKTRKDDSGKASRRYMDFMLSMRRHQQFYSGVAINCVTLEMSFDFSNPN